MKTPLLLIILLALFAGIASAGELPKGKYMFSSPALFGSADGAARGQVCELERTEDGYQIYFLDNPLSRGSRITFSIKGEQVVFDESHMPSTEIGRTITGKGKLTTENKAAGKLTVSMGSVGFLLGKRKSSEWSLRPATTTEVRQSFTKGLKMVEELMWAKRGRQKPTRENAIKTLSSAVGYGYSHKDVPELKRMMEAGELKYEKGKFFFRQTSPSKDARAPAISTNVYTEDIDLREHIAKMTNKAVSAVAPQIETASVEIVEAPAPPVPQAVTASPPQKPAPVEQKPAEPLPEPQKTPFPWNASIIVGVLLALAIVAYTIHRRK